MAELRSGRPDLTGLWMVPYADMMSTLVILFLSLFAYAYASRSGEFEQAMARLKQDVAHDPRSSLARKQVEEAELVVKLKEAVNGLALSEFGLHVTSRYVRLALPAPVLFQEGSAELSPDAARVLKPLAGLFSGVDHPILVEGHTDDRPVRGRWRTNWELSAARSYAVIEFFIRRGLDPGRFHARGYGEHRPASANDSPDGRLRNRRIEISLIREILPEEAPL